MYETSSETLFLGRQVRTASLVAPCADCHSYAPVLQDSVLSLPVDSLIVHSTSPSQCGFRCWCATAGS